MYSHSIYARGKSPFHSIVFKGLSYSPLKLGVKWTGKFSEDGGSGEAMGNISSGSEHVYVWQHRLSSRNLMLQLLWSC